VAHMIDWAAQEPCIPLKYCLPNSISKNICTCTWAAQSRNSEAEH